MEKKRNHAESNADGHAESILELYRAYTLLEDGAESAKADGEEFTSGDQIMERVQETPLSIQARSGWHNAGEKVEDEEFYILLTTGGPALRIIGDMKNGMPYGDFTMEVQDWGTPWTEYRPAVYSEDDWADALDWFVGCFYFGE
jgi:hypothetical protein